ncbi:hypothetical protein K438DRAFT_17181 [Mycena galopus ATCC 62051]|nr:hypothetical protein K438DRAFT_17181 [Mycena galopus ATCC 62051]
MEQLTNVTTTMDSLRLAQPRRRACGPPARPHYSDSVLVRLVSFRSSVSTFLRLPLSIDLPFTLASFFLSFTSYFPPYRSPSTTFRSRSPTTNPFFPSPPLTLPPAPFPLICFTSIPSTIDPLTLFLCYALFLSLPPYPSPSSFHPLLHPPPHSSSIPPSSSLHTELFPSARSPPSLLPLFAAHLPLSLSLQSRTLNATQVPYPIPADRIMTDKSPSVPSRWGHLQSR